MTDSGRFAIGESSPVMFRPSFTNSIMAQHETGRQTEHFPVSTNYPDFVAGHLE
ncbi:hypothetical protein PO883_22295 [Massilia sp. DJPM01]|uniref:hypothetical protein n=1 Tax=Massilia sp. DJPM01 TaxID=3024404 RepID=UPI00259F9CAB|nr:hypothetical protein [Massilia sp. DJPM01]MDM5179927.1 hypothetical protein [Massilia sp. DJPM01]